MLDKLKAIKIIDEEITHLKIKYKDLKPNFIKQNIKLVKVQSSKKEMEYLTDEIYNQQTILQKVKELEEQKILLILESMENLELIEVQNERLILQQYYILGKNKKDIAKFLNVSEKTIPNLLKKAEKKLETINFLSKIFIK